MNCRPVGGEGDEGTAGHCAIRVTTDSLDQTCELIPDGSLSVQFSCSGADDEKTKKYTGAWVQVKPPKGVSSQEFDKKVLQSMVVIAQDLKNSPYLPTGTWNSNHWVYSVITRAGGQVPSGVGAGFTLVPGICGGGGLTRGSNCAP